MCQAEGLCHGGVGFGATFAVAPEITSGGCFVALTPSGFLYLKMSLLIPFSSTCRLQAQVPTIFAVGGLGVQHKSMFSRLHLSDFVIVSGWSSLGMIFSIGGGAGAYRGHSSRNLKKEIRNQKFRVFFSQVSPPSPNSLAFGHFASGSGRCSPLSVAGGKPGIRITKALRLWEVSASGKEECRWSRNLENPKHVAVKEKMPAVTRFKESKYLQLT